MPNERLWSPEFISMGLTNFFIFISHYSLIASMPVIIIDHLGGTEMDTGLAMTFFQIGTVTFRPLAGRIIDAINKRRLMLAATILFFLTMLGYSFFHSLSSIYPLRIMHGIIFSLSTTAAAALAAMILPDRYKGSGIGYFAVTTNLAMVVGPCLGLVIAGSFGPSGLFIFLAMLGISVLISGNCCQLPANITEPPATKEHHLKLSDFIEKRSLSAAFFGGCVFFTYGGVLTLIAIYTKSLGMQSETSLFFAVFAAIIVFTRPFIGRLFDKKGPDSVIYPGLILFILGLFILGHIESISGLIIAAIILGLGFGAVSPAFHTLAVKAAPPERSGVATATYFWSLDISVGLAATLLSIAANQWGYALMYGTISTSATALTLLFYFIWRHH